MSEMDELIRNYFNLDLTCKSISAALLLNDGVVISSRQIKWILQRFNLHRRDGYSDLRDVRLFIIDQLRASGQLHEYRWMFKKCKANGLVVKKEDI